MRDVDNNDLEVLVRKGIAVAIADELSPNSLKAFNDAISKCKQPDKFKRPTIDAVVLDLEAALNFQQDFHPPPAPPPQPIPTTTAVELLNSSSTSSNLVMAPAISLITSSSYRQFSLGEIKKATNNFDPNTKLSSYLSSPLMPEYVANISYYDDTDPKSEELTLALVKRYSYDYQFANEVRTLLRIQVHKNIISLIGYCLDSDEKILVFKYTENSILENYLRIKGTEIWSWEKRVKICLDVAYGIQHFHRSTTEFPFGVVHASLRLSNILLDQNWDAKIYDFTLSTLGQISSPSAFLSPFHKPEDVYKLGIILINVLCWDYLFYEKLHMEDRDYNDLEVLVQKGIAIAIADQLSPDSLKSFAEAIRKCREPDKFKRLTIDDVVLDLEAALNFQQDFHPQPIPTTTLDLLNSSSSTRESRKMRRITQSDSLDELKEVPNDLKKISSSSSSSSISSSFSSLNISSSSSSSLSLFSPSYRQFSLAEINEVTKNLDKEKSHKEELYWIEYLVQMNLDSKNEKTWATVKQFKVNCADEFEKEIKLVTKIQEHPNLISFLGYCIESVENILIYNYTEHGSLRDYVAMDSPICLSWKERLNLCFGAASALQHLHKETKEFHDGLIHGDVNPANILLDKNWVAKVANYAGSHVSQIRSSFSIKDPWTRCAPEYEKSDHLTNKVDVYYFGIVLFQVLCRRRIWVQGEESKLGYIEESYARWANENVDISIREGISEHSLRAFTDCIGRCLESNPYRRPTMKRVVRDIETALSYQEDEGEAKDLNTSFRTTSGKTGVSKSSLSFSLSSSSCRQFPLTEIKEATNNFAVEKRLGKGGEGTVYLAEVYLDSESEKLPVAVKVLDKDFIGEFEKEIVTVTKIKHPNIVSLLGYCRESDDKVLIYEYMGKGSLLDYVKMNSKVYLSWKQRLNICLGAAYGLQHLHRETEEFPYGIIHRDVKPENILINDNWDAKVSDFGMLKLSSVAQTRSTFITLHAKGTPGYFAPECSILSEKQLTRKIDVYSFGLVMFEVLCLKKRWEVGDESIYFEENEDIALLADENIDVKIKHDISEASKYKFIDVIAASLRSDPKRRPSMNDVVNKLEAALKYQEQSELSDEISIPS